MDKLEEVIVALNFKIKMLEAELSVAKAGVRTVDVTNADLASSKLNNVTFIRGQIVGLEYSRDRVLKMIDHYKHWDEINGGKDDE